MLGIGLSKYIVILVYVSGIICVFVAIFSKPKYGLFILAPLIPLQNVMEKIHDLPFGKDFIDILVVSMCIGCVLKSAKTGERVIPKTPLNLPILCLFITSFISLAIGIEKLGGGIDSDLVEDFKNFFLMPVIYLLVVAIIDDLKHVRVLTVVMLVVMIPMDIYFYRSFGWVRSWHYSHDMRIDGVFTHLGPNELAAFYVQYSFIALSLFFFDRDKFRRILYLTVLGGNIYCIVFLYSRSAYLGVFLGFTIFSLLIKRKFIVPTVFGLILMITFAPVSVRERVSMTENEEGELDGSSQGRLDLWRFGLELFRENPVFGAGQHVYNISAQEIDRLGRTRDPHNMYVKTLAEKGVTGLLTYLLLYYVSAKSAWQLFRKSDDEWLKGFGAGLFICIMLNSFMNFFHDAFTYINLMGYYWVFIGLAVKSNIIMQEQVLAMKNGANK